jgi:Carboxypeptidase regulatory-like domain
MNSSSFSVVSSWLLAQRRWLGPLICLLILLLAMPFLATAQEGTILGTVTDASGAVIANVTVTITSVQTGTIRTFATNDAGQYVAPGLPVGTYDLKAEATGFTVQESKGIAVNVNDRIRIDFQMRLGSQTETVTVEANTIAVQTDSGEQSSLVNGTQLTELATNGRSIYTYVALSVGANNLMPSFQAPTSVGANANVSFNGSRPVHNIYLLDGGENDDRGGGGTSIVAPSVDAIAEMQTLTSNYSAEYGLNSGATVSSAVKSGTQSLHFSAWEFFRNDALDARNFFNTAPNPVAELRYNLFGFNVGGPVTLGKLYNPNKNKTFFFYNMEWRRLIQGQVLNQVVPLTANYDGNFSTNGYTLAQLHAPFVCQVSPAIQTQFAAAGQALSGCTNGAPDTTKEVAFNGNTIPTSLLNPNAQALLGAGGKYGGIFPAPTNGDYFRGGNNQPTYVREEIVRIDENISDKFTLFGHFVADSVDQTYGTTMWSSDNVPSVGNTFGNPAYAAVVHAAYAISPSLINETAFNYNGNRINIIPYGLVSAPSDFTFNRVFTGPNADSRIPQIQLGGSTGTYYTSNWTPWANTANSYQIRDDISWTKGTHQFKFGGGWIYYLKSQSWFQETQGGFNFNGFYTGNDFADFLLGDAYNYTENAVQDTGHWNNNSYSLYFQDNWRVNNRLTLNLGLRWDGIPHTYEANKVMSNFFPNLYNPAAAAQLNASATNVLPTSPGLGTSPNPILSSLPLYLNGIAVCGDDGTPRGCVNGAWHNFGPRLGFAYDLSGKGKTVIRGGYGIMYERVQGNDVYDIAGNVPFAAGVNFYNVSLSNPAQSVATGTTVPPGIPVSGITALDQNNYAAPRSSQFSLGIQQSIGNSVLSASYVGSQNRHQSFLQQMNLPPYGDLPALQAGTSTTPYNALLPYLGYNSISVAADEANSDYNALQISFRGNSLKRDLTYQVGYTYSHTNDPVQGSSNGFDLNNDSNPYVGWKYDWGPSYFDIRNNFFVNFVYDIPLLKNSPNHLLKTTLGGWEISGIVSAISGAPLNIGVTGTNVCSALPGGTCSNRPNVTGPLVNPHTVAEWFDTAAFSMPAPGTWGNEPHNGVRGPGRDNWNLSLFKNFVFNEERGTNLQFRAEFFNVWNHPQWQGDSVNNGISTNLGASNFGAITSAYDPRVIQLALKFSF